MVYGIFMSSALWLPVLSHRFFSWKVSITAPDFLHQRKWVLFLFLFLFLEVPSLFLAFSRTSVPYRSGSRECQNAFYGQQLSPLNVPPSTFPVIDRIPSDRFVAAPVEFFFLAYRHHLMRPAFPCWARHSCSLRRHLSVPCHSDHFSILAAYFLADHGTDSPGVRSPS